MDAVIVKGQLPAVLTSSHGSSCPIFAAETRVRTSCIHQISSAYEWSDWKHSATLRQQCGISARWQETCQALATTTQWWSTPAVSRIVFYHSSFSSLLSLGNMLSLLTSRTVLSGDDQCFLHPQDYPRRPD